MADIAMRHWRTPSADTASDAILKPQGQAIYNREKADNPRLGAPQWVVEGTGDDRVFGWSAVA